MCGPHGLKFLKPVELRLPHCASMTPDGWSFALKSSDSSAGTRSLSGSGLGLGWWLCSGFLAALCLLPCSCGWVARMRVCLFLGSSSAVLGACAEGHCLLACLGMLGSSVHPEKRASTVALCGLGPLPPPSSDMLVAACRAPFAPLTSGQSPRLAELPDLGLPHPDSGEESWPGGRDGQMQTDSCAVFKCGGSYPLSATIPEYRCQHFLSRHIWSHVVLFSLGLCSQGRGLSSVGRVLPKPGSIHPHFTRPRATLVPSMRSQGFLFLQLPVSDP